MKLRLKHFYIIILCLTLLCFTACTPVLRGKTAYELAVDNGFEGTEQQWLESLKGQAGQNGLDGKDGINFNDGYTVVDLYNEMVTSGNFSGTLDQFIRYYFSPDSTNEQQIINKSMLSVCSIVCGFSNTEKVSAGAGVFYSVDALNGDAIIITNYHVVYNEELAVFGGISNDITIYLYGSEYKDNPLSFKATFEGGTTTYDLAVLSVTASEAVKNASIAPVTFADSNEACLGESIYAIGNPEGKGLSVSSGILSVLSERITIKNAFGEDNNMRVMRFDAPVSPGNSGGGLFNSKGELLGIVNAKSVVTNVDGINYAIPANIIKAVMKHMLSECVGKENTALIKPTLGVSISEQNSLAIYDTEENKIKITAQVVVSKIEENSPAFGILEVGDRILSITLNGIEYEINNTYTVVDLTLGAFAGDTMFYKILRANEVMEKSVTITNECLTTVI